MDKALQSFANELITLRRKTEASICKKDYQHLLKIIWVNRIFLILGWAIAWIPNPFSMVFISLGLFGKWTIVAHHVCHGGYNKIPGIPSRYKSQHFAIGWRRYIDWLDWMYPPAWKYEHNTLHHFYTNEEIDPDVASERINQYLYVGWPAWLKATVLFINICLWKATYYSTNTLKAYYEKKNYDGSKDTNEYFIKAFFTNFIPYIGIHFILFPSLFLFFGWKAACFALINRIGAEFLTNIHSFLTIVPNHTGDDIPLQKSHFKSKAEFFINQINSSCNYKTGGFWRDYLQGYLNYQIEHHLFPDLPISKYVEIQPEIKALCEKYGVEYKQESILRRIRKTFDVLLKDNSTPQFSEKINY